MVVVRMLSGSAGTLLLAGTVLLVIYSLLVGMGVLWETLLADGYCALRRTSWKKAAS